MQIEITILITMYIIMLGPFKVIGPYASMTANADLPLKRQIAFKATLISTIVSLLIAVFGGYVMSRFNMSVGVVAITMGLFLLHWAVSNALAQPGQSPPPPEKPTVKLAIFPIAMPGIIPPQGIALLVLSSDLLLDAKEINGLMIIIVLIVAVMVLNYLFMLTNTWLMKLGVAFWTIFGRVLAVIYTTIASLGSGI